ncbi:protein ripply1 isoform X1 [Alexandromys fortis]|uniref:protein ripply1 isoform X1 n=1 Tax=Alexandromys fortis TaxID=100897 RepID=UPI002152FE28|nr:protein ripply1 isoform X1 [Microtus fortis]
MLDSGLSIPCPPALPRCSVNVLSSKGTLSPGQPPNRPGNRDREENQPHNSAYVLPRSKTDPLAAGPGWEAAAGATAAEVTKAEAGFRHPVRLFWPRSRSFDYLYSAGEMLLQNFPVQATINLYEDSDSEEDGEDKEKNVEEEVNEIGPEGCARAPEATPHKATAHSADPPLTCPN